MSDNSVPVTIKILDKEYTIACPPDEQEELRLSAGHLHSRMNDIKKSGKVVGADRIAVMAALNLTHEFLTEQKQLDGSDEKLSNRLKLLQEHIDNALSKYQQMDL